jgi:hypothetical protein
LARPKEPPETFAGSEAADQRRRELAEKTLDELAAFTARAFIAKPEVVDGPSLITLYRQLSFGRCRDGLSEECETTRAVETEHQVLAELMRGNR